MTQIEFINRKAVVPLLASIPLHFLAQLRRMDLVPATSFEASFAVNFNTSSNGRLQNIDRTTTDFWIGLLVHTEEGGGRTEE
jgi:hypothetical protein